MHCKEGIRLADFSAVVRESTVKRLKRVPEGSENWRIIDNSMSFADIAQHLIDADTWLVKKLETKSLQPILGKVSLVEITRREEYQLLIDDLKRTGENRRELLASLSGEQLEEQILDERFGGPVSAWFIIVRGNLDHEIHHRGQISAYLKLLIT
ncbi:MAG: DinB family protein [Candidatus Odinarchaeota archaeon]